jgi:hypothetical protein
MGDADAMNGTAAIRHIIDLIIRFLIWQYVLLAKLVRKNDMTLNICCETMILTIIFA